MANKCVYATVCGQHPNCPTNNTGGYKYGDESQNYVCWDYGYSDNQAFKEYLASLSSNNTEVSQK